MTVELKIDGARITGWRSVSIKHSLDEVAQQFTLSLWGVFSDLVNGTDLPKRYPAGTACEIIVDGELLVTGYVEASKRSVRASQYSYTIGGRSRTGLLVKSDAVVEGGQWKNRSLRQMAEDLCGPKGVPVVAQADIDPIIDKPFIRHAVHDGTKIAEVLSRMAKVRGLRLLTTPAGEIEFVRSPSSGNAAQTYTTVLRRGYTIEDGDFEEDITERHSRYLVKGQTHMRDGWRADKARKSTADVQDAGVLVESDLYVHPETQADTEQCQDRGAWERQQRAGASVKISYDVFGWTPDADVDLWLPNRLVRVVDPIFEINTDLLVVGVTMALAPDTGERTGLTLRLPQAYSLSQAPTKGKTGDLRW